mmetsp:Transcript_227/g.208  ORF Transcript_227/g.208 Transcript_227/m.208 type:complete len:245 (+) Transcript_227:706-1440(+)
MKILSQISLPLEIQWYIEHHQVEMVVIINLNSQEKEIEEIEIEMIDHIVQIVHIIRDLMEVVEGVIMLEKELPQVTFLAVFKKILQESIGNNNNSSKELRETEIEIEREEALLGRIGKEIEVTEMTEKIAGVVGIIRIRIVQEAGLVAVQLIVKHLILIKVALITALIIVQMHQEWDPIALVRHVLDPIRASPPIETETVKLPLRIPQKLTRVALGRGPQIDGREAELLNRLQRSKQRREINIE